MKRKLTVRALEIPFKGSFKHASAERSVTQTIWATAESEEGMIGLGEGCPREYVTGESVASALKFMSTIHDEVGSLADVTALRLWVSQHRELIDEHPTAWCSVEMALLDVMAREQGQSVEALLGTPEITGSFCYTAVLGAEEVVGFAAKFAHYRTMGFRDYKLKLSGTEDDSLRDEVLCLAEGVIDSLRLDANNLWTSPSIAVTRLKQLKRPFFAVEEPLSPGDYDGFRKIAEELGTRIILDESFLRAAQFGWLRGEVNPWIINLRISKMGGLLRSLDIAKIAREMRIPVIVGCQVGETSLLTRAALTIAQSIKDDGLYAQEGAFGEHLLHHDMVTPELKFGVHGQLDTERFKFKNQMGFGLQTVEGRS